MGRKTMFGKSKSFRSRLHESSVNNHNHNQTDQSDFPLPADPNNSRLFPISTSDNMIWMLLPFGKGLALPKLFGGREKKNLFYLEKAFCAVFFCSSPQ